MTLNDGFERTVSDWLDEQAGHGAPGYLDEVLARTTRTRQRPAWSSLERWLPVQSTAHFAPAPRIAWLLVILGLVLALGAAILVVGSPKHAAVAVRSSMRNGTVLYAAADGDIYAIDTASNKAQRPRDRIGDRQSIPVYSPDGTRFAFVRRDAGGVDRHRSSWRTLTVLALRELTGLPQDVDGDGAVTGRDQARCRRD